MPIHCLTRALIVAVAGLSAATTTHALHLLQIEQVVGGVNGDPSAQAVQLRMRASAQNIVSVARLVVRDASGGNPVLLKDFTTNVPNGQSGRRILVATESFTRHTNIPVSPDFIMDPIPASYLRAGRLTYEFDDGTIYWSFSWGGANYTGLHVGSTSNDADGNFGPAYDGPLPIDTRAVQFTGQAAALSTANAANYALTAGAATFINNANTSFTIVDLSTSITAIRRESTDIRVTWISVFAKPNILQRAAGPSPTNFIDILTIPSGSGSATDYLDPAAAINHPSAYYRVRIPL